MTHFYYWLKEQTERQDRVGKLARLAQKDKTFPQDTDEYNKLLEHIEKLNEFNTFSEETMKDIDWSLEESFGECFRSLFQSNIDRLTTFSKQPSHMFSCSEELAERYRNAEKDGEGP